MEIVRDGRDDAPFTQIVSLGERCSVAYNLRRHFDFRSAFPFDWWITTVRGLADFLRDGLDVEALYDPAQLERSPGARSVRHKTYGFLLHHEFPRHWDVPGLPVSDDFLEHIEGPKRRTSYLIEKLRALDDPGERILFVREFVEHETEAEVAALGDLRAALERLMPRANWKLAIVGGPRDEATFDWKCDPKAWDVELARLGAVLDRSRHRPFHEDEAANTDENIRQ